MIAGQPTIDDPAYAWDLVRVFPRQGEWQPEEYLVINRLTNHFVELHDGRIEVLEMPTKQHQKIAFRLATLLESHLGSSGEVVMAPYPLYVSEKTYREPDVIVALGAHREWLRDDYAEGADLVVEVLSQDRSRDLVIKREEYARAGIREYWLVDTRESRIIWQC